MFAIPWVKEDTYSSRYKEMVYEYTIQIQYAPEPPAPIWAPAEKAASA